MSELSLSSKTQGELDGLLEVKPELQLPLIGHECHFLLFGYQREVTSVTGNIIARKSHRREKFPRISGLSNLTDQPYFLGNIAAPEKFCHACWSRPHTHIHRPRAQELHQNKTSM